jgi:hypothetical protein
LSSFINCNGVILKEYQSLILNELTSSSRKKTLIFFTMDTGFEQLEKYIDDIKRSYFALVVNSD